MRLLLATIAVSTALLLLLAAIWADDGCRANQQQWLDAEQHRAAAQADYERAGVDGMSETFARQHAQWWLQRRDALAVEPCENR